MIQSVTQILYSISDYLIVFGITLFGVIVLFSLIFNKSAKRSRPRFLIGFGLTLILNTLVFLVIFLLFKLFGATVGDYGIPVFMFVIVLTTIFNLNLILEMRDLLPKTKKGSNIFELSKESIKENIIRVIHVSVMFLIIFLSMIIFGNGSIDSILILISLVILVCSLSSIFLFVKILKFSEKIFK